MWKYTHTDEMYHCLTNNTNKLFHSDIYLGKDYSDGLRHYKYLKKVKSPSGKWRYIYDESELKAEEKKIKIMDKTIDSLRDKRGYIHYTNKDGNSYSQHKDGHSFTTYGVRGKQNAKDKMKEKLLTETEKKKKKHNKQKLKDIPKRIISKGIGAVGKFIYDTEKKWIKK